MAQEKLAQQFEESCDLLRTLNSQRITQATAAQWEGQRAERLAARAREAEQKQRHLQVACRLFFCPSNVLSG